MENVRRGFETGKSEFQRNTAQVLPGVKREISKAVELPALPKPSNPPRRVRDLKPRKPWKSDLFERWFSRVARRGCKEHARCY